MYKLKALIIILIFFLFANLSIKFVSAQNTSSFPAAIHIQSNFSDGRLSIEQLIEQATAKDIKILIITDTILRRWEYGIWPLENIIKRKIEENSVIKKGIRNYLEAIKEAQKKNPDIILIAGIEVIPFYYWKGNIFKGNLALYDWHKQLLVIGLETIDAYKRLPFVGNRSFLPVRRGNFIELWPILIFIAGIFLLQIRKTEVFLFNGRIEFKLFKNIGYVFICGGILFLFNNIPFGVSIYEQYRGYSGIGPYQDLIDYVNKNNGMVFWAHPEASYLREFNNIKVVTNPYKYDLAKAKDYTGFASLYYDNITITKPGDLWDQILIDYCRGKRNKPTWGIGEIDYDANTFKDLDGIQTIFLLEDFSKKGVIEALRSGKMYAKLNDKKNDFYLSKFIITDTDNKTQASMGDEIILKGKPKIIIKTTCSYPQEKQMTLRLIRNGEIIKSFVLEEPQYSIEFQDDYYQVDEKIFYRLEIESDFSKIVSNPIFVKFSKD